MAKQRTSIFSSDIVVGYDGKQVDDGVDKTKKILGGLGDVLKEVERAAASTGAVFLGSLASTAVSEAVNQLSQGVRKLGDEFKRSLVEAGKAEDDLKRLETVLSLQGKTLEQNEAKIKAVSDAMFEYAGVAKQDVVNALTRMTVATGDLDKSMSALPAMFDLMAVSGQDIAGATRMISQAMEGNIGMIARYVPQLRGMIDQTSTFDQVMNALTRTISGQALAINNTFLGSISTFNAKLKELRVYMMEPVRDALTPGIQQLTTLLSDAIARGDFDKTRQLLGEIAQNIVNSASALWGGGPGVGGLIEGLEELLSKIRDYTDPSTGKFIEHLGMIAHAFSDLAGTAERAITAVKTFAIILGGLKGATLGASGGPLGAIGGGIIGGAAAWGAWEYASGGFDSPPAQGWATGGFVPGGPSPVKTGEYRLNPNATRALGKDLLDRLNFLVYPAGSTAAGGQPGGFAYGGYSAGFGGYSGQYQDFVERWAVPSYMTSPRYVGAVLSGMTRYKTVEELAIENMQWTLGNLQGDVGGWINLAQAAYASHDPTARMMWQEAAEIKRREFTEDEIAEAKRQFGAAVLAAAPLAYQQAAMQTAAGRAAHQARGQSGPLYPSLGMMHGDRISEGDAAWAAYYKLMYPGIDEKDLIRIPEAVQGAALPPGAPIFSVAPGQLMTANFATDVFGQGVDIPYSDVMGLYDNRFLHRYKGWYSPEYTMTEYIPAPTPWYQRFAPTAGWGGYYGGMATGSPGRYYASGGYIHGPGSVMPGDDTFAALKSGEYVLNVRATEAIGKDILDMINHVLFPAGSTAASDGSGYAGGGYIDEWARLRGQPTGYPYGRDWGDEWREGGRYYEEYRDWHNFWFGRDRGTQEWYDEYYQRRQMRSRRGKRGIQRDELSAGGGLGLGDDLGDVLGGGYGVGLDDTLVRELLSEVKAIRRMLEGDKPEKQLASIRGNNRYGVGGDVMPVSDGVMVRGLIKMLSSYGYDIPYLNAGGGEPAGDGTGGKH